MQRYVRIYKYTYSDRGARTGREVEHNMVKFHQFGVDHVEFENGPGNFSTAICELEDGTIIAPPVHLVQFIGYTG
jgi:hypothetical protein